MWEVFEGRAERYDDWFERNKTIFERELDCISKLVPGGFVLEVGVGTGRFAEKLADLGLDASPDMLKIAMKRVEVVRGDAHNLPFKNEVFDAVLIIVTICFLENPKAAIREAYRVLKRGGAIIIGFIPKDSALGKIYERKKKMGHAFYSAAKFFTKAEVEEMLTPFKIEEIRGIKILSEGDFLCIKAVKK